jgi:tetratricopeptide (TPR) repeat protein
MWNTGIYGKISAPEVALLSKFFLFALIFWLVRNPIAALLIFFAVLYVLDRRFVGLFPSFLEPIKRNRRLAAVKRELAQQPHNVSGKLEVARIYIEKRNYSEALRYLEQASEVYESADVIYELGLCKLKLGDIREGERLILQSLDMNPRVKYGEPYLRLGEAFAETDPDKAVSFLRQFRDVHSSSSEANYKLGRLYEKLGSRQEARQAYEEALSIYRALPRYKRRAERRWALLSRLRLMF